MIERTERLVQLLQDAIVLAETSRRESVLRHLQGARLVLLSDVDRRVSVQVDILSGRVFASGLPLALSPAELAIVIALAIKGRPVPRDVLADELYANAADMISASNLLRVNIHRVRRRLGSKAMIQCDNGRYTLGDAVDVEFPRLESAVRRLQLSDRLSDIDRDRLEQLRQRILDGRPAFVLEWEWFEETEGRIRQLGHDVSVALARDALNDYHYERAIELATEIAREDPLDEEAAEIAIRACLLAGNRTAAVLEYRRYAILLQREIDCEPSAGIRSLVES